MADYVTRWTGPLIDKGIDLALNGIGCKKYPDCTLDRPVDLNTFHDTLTTSSGETLDANGSWLIEFYINGPVVNLASANSTNYTPIILDVYVVNNITFQSLMADGVFYYRYAAAGSDFTMDWMMVAYPRLENDVSEDPSTIKVVDYRVELIDMLFLIVRIANDISDGATLTLNDHEPIPIYTTDGQKISSGMVNGSILPLVYTKNDNRFYLTGGGGTKQILETLDKKADKADPPLEENINTPMTKVTVNEQGIVTKVEQATTEDILHNGDKLSDVLAEINTDIVNMGNEGVKFTIDGTVPSEWGTIT